MMSQKKLQQMQCYLNPILGGELRPLIGRGTKIPYFRGGGVVGGNDGSIIFYYNY